MTPPTLEQPANLPTLRPDPADIGALANPLVEEASRLTPIVSRDEYKLIDALVGRLATVRKAVKTKVEEFFDPHVKRAKAVHQGLCDDRTKYLDMHDKPLAEALARAVGLMRTFEQEETKREADRKAEADRLAKIAQDEANKQAEKERQAQLKHDEDLRLARAAELEEAGNGAAAERVLTSPPPPPPPPPPPIRSTYVPPAALKASSATTRKNWTWKVKGEDSRAALLELVKAAAANPDAYLECLTFNADALKAKAKAGESQARVPGIEFYNDPISSNRAAR
jgi:hypothetical protein